MGLPMIPSPMNAIVLTSLLDSVKVVDVFRGRRATRAVRGATSRRCPRGWLARARHSRGSRAGRAGSDRQDVKLSWCRVRRALCVGDLHVPDAGGIRIDRRADVVPVHRKDTSRRAVAATRHRNRPGPGRSPRRHPLRASADTPCAADRLDEHHRTEPIGRLTRQRQILGRRLVLLLRRHALDPISVEGVECFGPQAFSDTRSDIDVVAERQQCVPGPTTARGRLPACLRPRSSSRSAAPDSTDERVDLAIRRHRFGEGPPEFDSVEPGVPPPAVAAAVAGRSTGSNNSRCRQRYPSVVLSLLVSVRRPVRRRMCCRGRAVLGTVASRRDR